VVRTPDEERRRRLEELVQKKRELEEMEKHIRRESQKIDDEMRMLSQEGTDQWQGAVEAHEVSNYGERGCGWSSWVLWCR
jgi:hypothetical protein